MDSDFTTGNRTVDRMSRINITGNVIPAAWYKNCVLVPGSRNQG